MVYPICDLGFTSLFAYKKSPNDNYYLACLASIYLHTKYRWWEPAEEFRDAMNQIIKMIHYEKKILIVR